MVTGSVQLGCLLQDSSADSLSNDTASESKHSSSGVLNCSTKFSSGILKNVNLVSLLRSSRLWIKFTIQRAIIGNINSEFHMKTFQKYFIFYSLCGGFAYERPNRTIKLTKKISPPSTTGPTTQFLLEFMLISQPLFQLRRSRALKLSKKKKFSSNFCTMSPLSQRGLKLGNASVNILNSYWSISFLYYSTSYHYMGSFSISFKVPESRNRSNSVFASGKICFILPSLRSSHYVSSKI